MKILHVNTYNTGGAAKACLRLHEALLDNGVDSKVLVRNKTVHSTREVYEVWEEMNYIEKGKKYLAQKQLDKKQQKIRNSLGPVDELFSFPESIWDLTQHPLFEWADIIHLHWVAGFVDYKTFFTNSNKKIVWTIHDEEPFSGGFHYPPNLSASAYNDLIQEHGSLKENAFKNQAITVVSPSQFLADKSKGSALFSGLNHEVIKNCADTQNYFYQDKETSRKALGLPLDKKIILFVSDSLDYPRKGYAQLVEATSPLLNETTILCTVGKHKDDRKAKEIVHLGAFDSDEKMSLAYAAADLLVVPSLMDNLPNTISEALCCGTPVVAFSSGGIPEMLTERNGVLCEVNVGSLVDGLECGLKMEWDREGISKIGHRLFGQEECAAKYIEVYSKVCNVN
ncbi:MAG: glycosyltransferase involved in cell wall biosynthesis [Crocinitomicaceae bacterium]|jgi:glycosyltransferase involved in cell wall biosynthesis